MKVLNFFVLVFLLTTVLECVQARGRIFNGMNAVDGQAKSLCRLKTIYPNGDGGLCGGSVLDHYTILTAAHCLKGVKGVTIYCGSINLKDEYLAVHANADGIIIHKDYNSSDTSTDIGLIKTSRYIPFDDKVQPVQLYTGKDLLVGRNASICGWGSTKKLVRLPPILQCTYIQVISNKDCKAEHSERIKSILRPTNLCANGVEANTRPCQGDSGSPIFLENSDVQIGMSSFLSSAGCDANLSHIFTRVSSYVDWIRSHMQ